MDHLRTKCYICLSPVETDVKLDSKNKSLMVKLQNVVPEVEWSEDSTVCKRCNAKVNIAYKFRTLCIERDLERKAALAPVIAFKDPFPSSSCKVNPIDNHVIHEHNYAQSFETKEIKVPEPLTVNKFECNTCKKSYSNEELLNMHLKQCELNQNVRKQGYNLSCEVCNLPFKTVRLVVAHCYTEHSMNRKSIKPYTCNKCPKRFPTSTQIMQHDKYHSGSRSYVCSFCGKAYKTGTDLHIHEYSHLNRRDFMCEFCSKAFNIGKNLRAHILLVHTDKSLWKFSCDQCSRRFPNRSMYNLHMKRHAGDKQFGCHICTKSFVTKSELQKHIEYHSSVKPFKCDLCEKEFKNKWARKMHFANVHGSMKTPAQLKKFACHVCPITFSHKESMRRHLRKHAGGEALDVQEIVP